MAAARAGVGGAQPEQRRLARCAQRDERGKGGGAGRVERVGGEKFMGAPGRQPAADRRVEARVSARQPALGRTAFETTTGGYPGDAFPQPGERGGRLAHHLFLICSISARVRASVKASTSGQLFRAKTRRREEAGSGR